MKDHIMNPRPYLHYVFIEPKQVWAGLHTGMGMDKLIHGVGTMPRYIPYDDAVRIPQV